jgi:shikimate dehydrogenase
MKQFGLLGKSLAHSFSKSYFEEKFKNNGLKGCSYKNFEIDKIEKVHQLVKDNLDLVGFNVTIPYKESIIPFLSSLDKNADSISSVNTVLVNRKDLSLKGFNTDYIGFKQSIKPFLELQHTHALVFGNGGSSKAIAYALKQLGIKYFIVTRTPKEANEIAYSDLDEHSISRYKLLINTTPLGMFPNEDASIDIPYKGIGEQHLVYDLIYNPSETQFLKKAKQEGAICMNGIDMLQLQAEASWEIWNKQKTT